MKSYYCISRYIQNTSCKEIVVIILITNKMFYKTKMFTFLLLFIHSLYYIVFFAIYVI